MQERMKSATYNTNSPPQEKVGLLEQHKVDFKARRIATDKKKHFTTGSKQQEYLVIL